MIAAAQPDFYDDHAWLIGEDASSSGLSDPQRRLRETRIAAAIFRRRSRLLFHWRQQAHHRPAAPPSLRRHAPVIIRAVRRSADADGDVVLTTNLPRHLAPLRGEIVIWRSFLDREIQTILFGND